MNKQYKNKQLNILVAPDKFKGSLDATEVCQAVEEALMELQNQFQNCPKISVQKVQLADGGQGTLQILKKCMPKLQKVQIYAKDPLFRQIKTEYLSDKEENIAYLQMAKIAGLSLLAENQRNPVKTTTYGVGQIINELLLKQFKKIYLFIGGSATNDAGIGMANALGYKFYDKFGIQLLPTGQNLIRVHRIQKPSEQLMNKIVNTEISVVSDVQNVLYGKNGAAYVYAPQKGADKQSVQFLDKGLQNLAQKIKSEFNLDLQSLNGSGAAGGLGGGAKVFLKAKMEKGIQTILDLLNIDQKIQKSDLVITGQGKLDRQTLEGKVVFGVLKRATRLNKRLWIVCGANQLQIQTDLFPLYPNISVLALVDQDNSKQQALLKTRQLIKLKVKESLKVVLFSQAN